MIAPRLGARGDGEIGLVFCIDEYEPDVVLGFDLVLLAAADVGDEPNDTGIALGSRFERPRTPSKRVVSMAPPTCSMISQTRSIFAGTVSLPGM